MGYFYSLGISFDTADDAQQCCKALREQNLILSDSTIVDFDIEIQKGTFNNAKQQYICGLFPNGMDDWKTNFKLFELPYFYEIRDQLYSFLFNYSFPFNYAHWEAEAADRLIEDVASEFLETNSLNQHHGFGKDEFGDPNASYFSKKNSDYYQNKKYWDGLVISKSKIPINSVATSSFLEFKPGYLWLPVEIKN